MRGSSDLSNSIAVVGLVGRFPGARGLKELWQNLCEGKETISFFTEEELLEAGVNPATIADPNYVPARGVYKRPFGFDARFFGYTPREAELMDPQQRVFLECCWEALEVAGYDASQYPGRIGVFGGAGTTQYLFRLLFHPIYHSTSPVNVVSANDKDYLCTRVGYKLNLRGPCVTVQTACSTSLVATVLGCQSLRAKQADMILAGGVSVVPDEVGGYRYDEGSLFSPDGHCRSFDASARGTIFSSGVGVFVLKRFEDAVADNDTIYAVIRGFALTNDAAQRAYFTAAGIEGQAAATQQALAMSGLDPETISYVECHGTGTVVGDPIEIKALTKAFRNFTEKRQFCAVGSIKSNIGHADAAAGAAGLAKAVLSLRHRLIPPSLHFKTPNPSIQFEQTPFFVNTELREWTAPAPLRAGVNSFGMGGTNAHVVVEEAPPLPATSPSRPKQLLLLSARTPTALDALAAQLKSLLLEDPPENFADLAYTLQVGRRGFEHRRWLVCDGAASAVKLLGAQGRTATLTTQQCQQNAAVAFLFPGQGAQHVGMARELYDAEPAFRSAFDECARLFAEHLGADLREVVYPEADDAAASERLRQTLFTQPALFSVEYALTRLWEEWGVRPGAMLGHSIGEYVAACVAGVFSLEDAAALVSARSRLMQSLPGGSMLGVFLSEEEVLPLLEESPGLSLAAVNGPSTSVVSGADEAVASFAALLDARGVMHRPINTSHAFHSSMMEPILEEFRKHAARVKFHEPAVPYISNVTGTWATAADAANPEYWVQHLRRPVRFYAGVRQLLQSNASVFLEVGPGKTLSALVAQGKGDASDVTAVASLPPARDPAEGDLARVLEALGQLWGAGVRPDWRGFYARESRRRIAATTYPFEREDYGITAKSVFRELAKGKEKEKPAGRRAFDDWFYTINWARTSRPRREHADGDAGTWLLFLNGTKAASRLARRLSERGVKTIKVFPGASFDSAGDDEFSIRIGAEEDYKSLFDALSARHLKPTQVIHALALTDRPLASDSATCDEVLENSFYSPLFLVKGLARYMGGDPLTLTFMCSQAFDVVGSERTSPLLATLVGPGRVAASEIAGFHSRIIDVEIADGDSPRAGCEDALLNELFDPAGAVRDVAFRGGHRWEPRMDSITLPEPEGGRVVRPGGVYLVTAGLTGIGLELARSLAKEAEGVRLILTGRMALPGREAWPQYLEGAGADDAAAQRIREVLSLEAAGAEVLAVAADVSDAGQMREVVATARERFGAINGVVHSAGVTGSGIIELKERGTAEAVLRPKVKGCLVLSEVLADEDLDFFVLCSSNAALAGDAGLVDYTAANAFLDAFAWSKRGAAKNRLVSINWDRWEEIGMAARLERQAAGERQRLAQGVAGQPIEHPLFTKRAQDGGGETFVVAVSTGTHWIAGEHTVMGVPTVVGASHVEHVYRAYALLTGQETAEITDLIFLQPVALEDGEVREVAYTLSPAGEGRYEFKVWSVGASGREEHAQGRIGAYAHAAGGARDPDEIFARCGKEREPSLFGEDWPKTPEEAPIYLGPHWDRFVRIAESDSEALAELSLSNVELEELNTYRLHPSVFDCAVSYVAGPRPETPGLYLPFAYSRIRIAGKFAPRMFSHKRFKPGGAGAKEILSYDVTLFDESGNTVLEVEDYVIKRVPRGAGAAEKAGAAAGRAPQEPRRETPRDSLRILPEEGVRAFRRVLAAPGLPQVIVSLDEPGRHEVRSVKKDEREAAEVSAEPAPAGRAYSRPDLQTPYVAPSTEVEEAVAEIWQSVLGIDRIGVHDDFIELGGHSLLAIQASSRMRETFAVDFSVTDFYKNPTVEALATLILEKLIEQLGDESLDELIENR